jgi:hypothetical protein
MTVRRGRSEEGLAAAKVATICPHDKPILRRTVQHVEPGHCLEKGRMKPGDGGLRMGGEGQTGCSVWCGEGGRRGICLSGDEYDFNRLGGSTERDHDSAFCRTARPGEREEKDSGSGSKNESNSARHT